MLRKKILKLALEPKFYKTLVVLFAAISFLNYVFIPTLPLRGEKNHIEENAMMPIGRNYKFDGKEFDRIMRQLKNLDVSKNSSKTLDYIADYLQKKDVMPYIQEFSVVVNTAEGVKHKTAHNLVGVLHSPRAQRDECNVILFSHDLSSKNGKGLSEIALPLAFINLLATEQDLGYLARDTLILAYDGRYKGNGRAIKAFFDGFYKGEGVGSDFPRCGLLRQAINIEIDNDEFNFVVLMNDGLNGQLNDFDLYMNYNILLEDFLVGQWALDEDLKYETKIDAFFNEHYFPILNKALQSIYSNPRVIPTVYLAQTLASLKRKLIGRTDVAHSYFQEGGCYAMTLRGIKVPGNRPNDTAVKLGRVIETTNRANMVLQEQLHAGSMQYVTIDSKNHITIGRCLVPFLIQHSYRLVSALISYYLIKKKFFYFKWIWSNLSYIASGVFICFLPSLIEATWNSLSSTEAYYYYDEQENAGMQGGSDTLAILFLVFSALVIVVVRPLVNKLGCHVFENYIPAITGRYDPDELVLENEWYLNYVVPFGYLSLGTVVMLTVNLPFGILGVLFVEPILFLIRPMNRREIIYNLLTATLILLEIAGAWYLLTISDTSLYSILKELLAKQSRNSYMLWNYICLVVMPGICMIWELAVFSFKNKHLAASLRRLRRAND